MGGARPSPPSGDYLADIRAGLLDLDGGVFVEECLKLPGLFVHRGGRRISIFICALWDLISLADRFVFVGASVASF